MALEGPGNGEAGKAWPAIAIGLFVSFGGVLFGCVCPALPGRNVSAWRGRGG